MKLTADRNEAPPKKKKKLKRKSKEKNQKQIQSPQRKPLIVDKVCLFSKPIFSDRSHLRRSIISDNCKIKLLMDYKIFGESFLPLE